MEAGVAPDRSLSLLLREGDVALGEKLGVSLVKSDQNKAGDALANALLVRGHLVQVVITQAERVRIWHKTYALPLWPAICPRRAEHISRALIHLSRGRKKAQRSEAVGENAQYHLLRARGNGQVLS
jgi:hypothetical protein